MPFVGHLETGHQRPSEKTIAKLAKVLGLDQQELFLLANPGIRAFFRSQVQRSTSEAFGEKAVTEPAVTDYQRALSKLVHYRSDDACTGEDDLGALGL